MTTSFRATTTPPKPWTIGDDQPGPDGLIRASNALYDADGEPLVVIRDPRAAPLLLKALEAHEGIIEILQAMCAQAKIAIAFGYPQPGRLHLTEKLEARAFEILESVK